MLTVTPRGQLVRPSVCVPVGSLGSDVGSFYTVCATTATRSLAEDTFTFTVGERRESTHPGQKPACLSVALLDRQTDRVPQMPLRKFEVGAFFFHFLDGAVTNVEMEQTLIADLYYRS